MIRTKVIMCDNSIELIKYIALFSMFIDHSAIVFFDDNLYLRGIGRFAFIAFAFILAYNYRYNTKNKYAFKKRLFQWAIISQIPFMLIFPSQVNILFLLLFGLLAIDSIEEMKNKIFFRPIVTIFFSLIVSLFSGYAIFGLLIIVLFYYFFERPKEYLVLILVDIFLLNGSFIFGIIGIIFFFCILFVNTSVSIKRTNGYFFYLFYPIHLVSIFLISQI